MRDIGELLGAWASFYVMVGSSAATLTGLVFVVITLVKAREGFSKDGMSTFTSPTVVHFCCALFAAAFLSAPLRSVLPIAMLLGATGVFGVIYAALVGRKTTKLQSYQADRGDWIWNVVLPFVAYALFLVGAIALPIDPSPALFAPAAASLLLIFVGIHNAWDVVTYLALAMPEPPADPPHA